MQYLDAQCPYVFFCNGIGDAVLNLPALRALSRLFSGRLGLITPVSFYRTFFHELQLRDVVLATFWRLENRRVFDADKVAGRIAGCDLFLSLVPWHSGAVDRLLEQVRPAESIGYFDCFDVHIPLDYDKHTSHLGFDLPRFLKPSLQFGDFLRPPELPADAVRRAKEILEFLPPRARVVCIHADTMPEKMWTWAKFSLVLKYVLEKDRNCWVCIVGAKSSIRDVSEQAARVIPCGGLSLATSCALVANADFFLGVDSCMLHVADFFGVPCVGLFGPTNPREFGCLIAPHRHVVGGDSLEDIDPEDVIEQIEQLCAEMQLWKRPVNRVAG
jgi:hypothetical protein